ncbi:hypothetical protein GQ53DRAFT_746550 [Thozetella sp. PMI_491]|nr:hypothetical protein GQ53DRAFT_746550 [Thozetella sp. PMI_491]
MMDDQIGSARQRDKSRADDVEAGGRDGDAAHAQPQPTPLRPLEKVPTYLQPPIPVRERMHHFTFAWYTVTMSTGGIALVLAETPHRFAGLNIIGLVVFLVDVLFFTGITACLLLRFVLYRHTFHKAFTHPSEALFISTFFLSVSAMLCNARVYGSMFLGDIAQAGLYGFLRVMFWVYLTVTFFVSVLQYHLLFTVKAQRRLTINSMTPGWILPIFPTMLAGTLAASISHTQPPNQALAIVTAGLAAQGLGMLVSIMMYATYLSRLVAFGLPAQRPGMFIAVGPPSFTCAALVTMASDVPRIFTSDLYLVQSLSNPEVLADAIRLASLCSSIFLWGLSFWFFTSAVTAVVAGMPDSKFHLSWWSFVFPNVGFTIASIRIGTAFGSEGVLWMSSAMTIILLVVWAIVACRCVRAVIRREIVWPGHDEDSE